MVVNGLKLPASFVEFVQTIRDNPLRQHWQLIEPVDAHGNHWEADLDIYTETGMIIQETAELAEHFGPEARPLATPEIQKIRDYHAQQPGHIPDIDDFTNVICFGRTASGEKFCFDFRGNREEPIIIFWNDGHWRRVAPDFSSFIRLFEPFGEYEVSDVEADESVEKPSGKVALLGLFEPHEQSEWLQKLRDAERGRFNEEVRKWRESEPPHS
jgi:hypothetical protein